MPACCTSDFFIVSRHLKLMLLHADTLLPEGCLAAAEKVLEDGTVAGGFELKIDGHEFPLA